MSWFYYMLKRFFLSLKRLFDASVASSAKKEYDSAVHLLCILMKSLVLISAEWFNTIYWGSLLSGLFMIKKWVEFSLTSFGTLKYGWVIKTREMFNFVPLINNLVTIEFRFLLLIISAIISPKTINILRSLSTLYLSIFYKHFAYHLNTY